uniref:PTC1-like winged helix-turn-helix domain-containing protein n=1 Tax=Musa acuminata subsp. malaccensis TaxID=214687 RepID=A0A804HXH4_MUSAM
MTVDEEENLIFAKYNGITGAPEEDRRLDDCLAVFYTVSFDLRSFLALCELIDGYTIALLVGGVRRIGSSWMETPWEKLKYYYSKRNDSTVSKERQGRWAFGGQALADATSRHASPCDGTTPLDIIRPSYSIPWWRSMQQWDRMGAIWVVTGGTHRYMAFILFFVGALELDAFYKIDHEKLPPKSPIQLKAIRVVKVCEATKLEVTVSFPSTLALRNYFALSPEPGREPELDERFVMSSNQAARILRLPVPPSDLEVQKHLLSFWLSNSNLYDSPPFIGPPESVMEVDEVDNQTSLLGHCLLTIKQAGFVGWGIRRKVKYIGRQRDISWSSPEEEKEEVQADEEQLHSEKKRKREVVEEERKKNNENKRGKKGENKKEKKKKPRRDRDDNRRYEEKQQQGKGTRDRWSSERYEAAEMKLLEIMKEKGAELGKPIMRHALREEARKHIGDTGLLDHLLKHMAGKVVTNGTERFRRRHNSEGAMEYWLEPADFVEVRQKAGVADPYWVPPPGWKPGDAPACPCDGEIRQLREELSLLKRDMDHLNSLKQLEKVVNEAQPEPENGGNTWQEEIRLLKEEKEKKNMEMEAMKEDKGVQYEGDDTMQHDGNENKRDGDANDGNSNSNITDSIMKDTNNNSNSNISNLSITAVDITKSRSATTNSKRVAARRSGFRICKPQGTFLWPDMWSSTSSSSAADGGAGVWRPPGSQVVPNPMMTTMTTATIEEHLMLLGGVPTPSSASTATSAPRLLLLPSPASPAHTHPPEVMAVPPPPPPPHHHNHHLQMLQQTGGSCDICPSVVYRHMVARNGERGQQEHLQSACLLQTWKEQKRWRKKCVICSAGSYALRKQGTARANQVRPQADNSVLQIAYLNV